MDTPTLMDPPTLEESTRRKRADDIDSLLTYTYDVPLTLVDPSTLEDPSTL